MNYAKLEFTRPISPLQLLVVGLLFTALTLTFRTGAYCQSGPPQIKKSTEEETGNLKLKSMQQVSTEIARISDARMFPNGIQEASSDIEEETVLGMLERIKKSYKKFYEDEIKSLNPENSDSFKIKSYESKKEKVVACVQKMKNTGFSFIQFYSLVIGYDILNDKGADTELPCGFNPCPSCTVTDVYDVDDNLDKYVDQVEQNEIKNCAEGSKGKFDGNDLIDEATKIRYREKCHHRNVIKYLKSELEFLNVVTSSYFIHEFLTEHAELLGLDTAISPDHRLVLLLSKHAKDLDQIRELKREIRKRQYAIGVYRRFNYVPTRFGSLTSIQYFENDIVKERRLFNEFSLNYGPANSRIAFGQEVYHDYFGPFRVGLNALVTNLNTNALDKEEELEQQAEAEAAGEEMEEAESTAPDAFQRLISGGGNLSINISTPLLTVSDLKRNVVFDVRFSPQFAFDVPQLGTTQSSDIAYHFNVGGDISFVVNGFNKVLNFFAVYRPSFIAGNGDFHAYLGRTKEVELEDGTTETQIDRSPFWLHRLTIGIDIDNTYRLGFSYYTGAEDVRSLMSEQFTVRLGVITGNIGKDD